MSKAQLIMQLEGVHLQNLPGSRLAVGIQGPTGFEYATFEDRFPPSKMRLSLLMTLGLESRVIRSTDLQIEHSYGITPYWYE
jgi:hypothetical protein